MDDKLYPELTEAGELEAKKAMDQFREAMKLAADEAIDTIYCHVLPHIESDSWSNYRQFLLDGLSGYTEAREIDKQRWKGIRALILKEHREEIINDLNQDNIDKIKSLEKELEFHTTQRR